MCVSRFTYVRVQADIALFGESQVRRQILERFFSRPGVVRHVRELARELDRSPTIVGAQLDRRERTGVLTSERIGRARRYRVDENSPIAAEIRSLVRKTIGVEARLRSALADLDGVEDAFLYGSYARGDERATSDLDLFVIGAVDQEGLSERLADVERELDRDVNVTTYERAELERLRAAGDRFIEAVFAGPRVSLLPIAASA
jgi:predicted nucleotidyltransferase